MRFHRRTIYILTTIFSLFLSPFVVSEGNQRVVSLAPVITEIISALNLESKLVGKTKFCKLEDQSLKVKSVGGYLDSSLEGIYSLSPDLVILLPEQKDLIPKLEKLDIKTLTVSNRDILSIQESILLIAKSLGDLSRGERLVEDQNKKLAQINLNCKKSREEIRTLFIFDEELGDRTKFFAAGQNTFYGEMMKSGNLKNVLTSKQDYLEIGLEGIVALKPEKIFLVTEKKDPHSTIGLLSKYGKLKKEEIVVLPKRPTLFPGVKFPEIYQSFLCTNTETLNGES